MCAKRERKIPKSEWGGGDKGKGEKERIEGRGEERRGEKRREGNKEGWRKYTAGFSQ